MDGRPFIEGLSCLIVSNKVPVYFDAPIIPGKELRYFLLGGLKLQSAPGEGIM